MQYQTYNMLNPGIFRNRIHNDEFESTENSNLFTIVFVTFLLAGIAGIIIYHSIDRYKEPKESNT